MLGQDQKSNPAVPPGLTRTRPTHPYHHTVALFTECRSVAHRAGIPPSDCPPKSIHTIQSVPRSQLRAALCDILRTGYLLFINGFNSFMKLFWILLLHCDKVKRKFLTCTPPPEAGEYKVLPCDKVKRVFYPVLPRRRRGVQSFYHVIKSRGFFQRLSSAKKRELRKTGTLW